MRRIATLLVSSLLVLGAASCSDTAKTSSEAPETTSQVGETPVADEAQSTQEDGTSEVRRQQLDSDIRAREERNNVTGGDAERADGDLESEIRSKLEANLPASQLAVDSEEGVVTISGTVPTQPQFERIEPLALEIKGVKEVVVNATVAPAQPES